MRSARLAAFAVLALILLALAPPASAGPLTGALAGLTTSSSFTLDGTPCRLIAVPAAAPVGTGSCPGVRPGAVVQSDIGLCTFNFVYLGSDGRTYIGTAGHCILANGGEQSWAPGTGPVARDADGNRIGEFAYAILQDPKDISLIRVDPGIPVNPQMCHFGGPTGIDSDQPSASTPVILHHFGNGIGISVVLPARSAVALGMPSPDHVYAEGLVAPGDSGSGIIADDGRAVGVIVTVGLHLGSLGTSGIDAGTMGITRLAPQLARAAQVTGVTYSIVTAPTL